MKFNEWQDSVKKAAEKLLEGFYEMTSQPGRMLKRFPLDAELERIGCIQGRNFPFIKKRFYIDLYFSDHSVSCVPLELIPMLVIGSRYQNKNRIPNRLSQTFELTVSRCSGPFTDSFGAKWLKIADSDGRIFRIQQLELARALFLHNVHLTRTAFRPNGLAGLANIEIESDLTIVRFNRMSDYPVTSLRSRAARSHLSWMLLDPQARKSFGSILEGWMSADVDLWQFEFRPPELNGWLITACGRYDQDQGEKGHVVEEVISLHNPFFNHPHEIKICHPHFREIVLVNRPNEKKPEIDPINPDPELNLHGFPRLGRKLDRVADQRFSFTFGEEPNVDVIAEKQLQKLTTRVNKDKLPKRDEVGVGHAEENGTAQELDYGINRPQNEPEKEVALIQAESTPRFLLFKKVIEELLEKPNYRVGEIKCYELPKPRTNRLVALNTTTGKPALFHLATLYYFNLPLVIIEVDTESLKKTHTLSTLILSFNVDPSEGIKGVMQACSDSGVRWNKGVIEQYCSVGVFCKHPHKIKHVDDEIQARTPEEYCQAWISIFEKRIEQIFRELKGFVS